MGGLTSESAIVIIVANKTEQNPREVTEQEVSRRCILIAQSRLDPGEPSIWYSSGHVICNGKRCTIFRNERQKHEIYHMNKPMIILACICFVGLSTLAHKCL